MIEVFYEESTPNTVIAWRSGSRQGIRKCRPGEYKVLLDILPPKDKGTSVNDYRYDKETNTLKLRFDFVPLPPPRDLLAEIDELKARLDKITKVKGVA